jgi:hypothetical protein
VEETESRDKVLLEFKWVKESDDKTWVRGAALHPSATRSLAEALVSRANAFDARLTGTATNPEKQAELEEQALAKEAREALETAHTAINRLATKGYTVRIYNRTSTAAVIDDDGNTLPMKLTMDAYKRVSI